MTDIPTTKTKVAELREAVAVGIKALGTAPAEAVISNLVQKELDRRVDVIMRGLEAWQKASRELSAIKPDQKSFGSDGKIVAETFSEAKIKERKEAGEKFQKISEAMEKALAEEPDFQPIEKFIK